MKIEIGQVISQIIAFLIMLWVLKRYAWKPLLGVMEERRNKIKSDFASIDKQKTELDELIQYYKEKLAEIDEEADAKINKAIKKGHEHAQTIHDEAQRQAKLIIAKAQVDLGKEVVKAKQQLKNELINMTLMATEKMLDENLDREKQKKLILNLVEKENF